LLERWLMISSDSSPGHCKPFPTGNGAIAQLVERLLCKQDVVGSTPSGSTTRHAPRGGRPEAHALGAVIVLKALAWTFYPRANKARIDRAGIAHRRSTIGIDIVKEELIRPVHRLSGSVREKTLSDKNQAGTRWHFFPVSGLFPA